MGSDFQGSQASLSSQAPSMMGNLPSVLQGETPHTHPCVDCRPLPGGFAAAGLHEMPMVISYCGPVSMLWCSVQASRACTQAASTLQRMLCRQGGMLSWEPAVCWDMPAWMSSNNSVLSWSRVDDSVEQPWCALPAIEQASDVSYLSLWCPAPSQQQMRAPAGGHHLQTPRPACSAAANGCSCAAECVS